MELWNGDTAAARIGASPPDPLSTSWRGGTILLLVVILTLVVCAAARGQILVQTRSFVFARYASGTSSSLIAARGLGAVGGFVAMVQNPATQYRERVAGAYTQASWKSYRLFAALAYADASESPYLQAFFGPSFTRGRLALSGTFKSYEPLSRAGVRQLHLNPASLEIRLGRRMWTGVAYTLAMKEATPHGHSVGPVVQWTLPAATLRVELLDRVGAPTAEIRCVVVTSF